MTSPRTRTSSPDPAPGVLRVRGAREHNLRDVHVEIPLGRLTVLTGVSGSGKSSLAFDTIHAEGQRRYLEGLAPRVRRRLGRRTRPDVDGIDGLPPTLAVGQLASTPGPRSTVGTLSEVLDLLRLLYARAGTVHCPSCDRPVTRTEPARMVANVMERDAGTRFLVLAPFGGEDRLDRARREGFVRIRSRGEVLLLDELAEEPRADQEIEIVVDRLRIGPDVRGRLQDSVETALRVGEGRIVVSLLGDGQPEDLAFCEDYRCATCDVRIELPTAATFSFNGPRGACPACSGLGEQATVDATLLFSDPDRPLRDALEALPTRLPPREARETARTVRAFARAEELPLTTRIGDLPAENFAALLQDEVGPWLETRRAKRSGRTRRPLEDLARREPCPACGGRRLRPAGLAVRLDGLSIADLASRDVRAVRAFLAELTTAPALVEVVAPVLDEARARLDILVELGLGYLTLDRRGATLSGGELQRIRLGTRLGSELVGVLYVLDEPTAGLHPADTEVLLGALARLRDRGNTLVLVEHDPAVVRAADHLVELGPGAGRDGGALVAAGPRDEVLSGPSATARSMRGEVGVRLPERRQAVSGGPALVLEGAAQHNLRNVSARFPLGALIAVTGVSGAGKSTLARDVLLRALRGRLHGDPTRPGAHRSLTGVQGLVAAVEIAPVAAARSLRSVPATAAGLFAEMRRLFAESVDARVRGFRPARFSFNRKGGRCAACEGLGETRVAMDFLPDVRVTCDLCGGRRYDPETLQVRFRGLSIADVLERTVDEVLPVFRGFPRIAGPLEALARVGLGYLPLGQPGRTLSGGETQRLRLAVELARPAAGPTLYLLDEPTAGLHALDVARLVETLRGLVSRGHTVVVVEHDVELVKVADWVVDLGPGGGPDGGRVVAEGPPEAVAACTASRTARYLRAVLAAD